MSCWLQMSSSFLLFISPVIRENSCASGWDTPGNLKQPDANSCFKKKRGEKEEESTPSQDNVLFQRQVVFVVEIKGEKLGEGKEPDFHLIFVCNNYRWCVIQIPVPWPKDHSFLFEKCKLSHHSHLSVQMGDLAVVSLFLLKMEVRQGFHP